MMKSVAESFSIVRTFYSTGEYGIHLIASMQPLPLHPPEELAAKLSQKSAADLIERGPQNSVTEQFREVLEREELVEKFIAASPVSPVLSDDRPVNEFFGLDV